MVLPSTRSIVPLTRWVCGFRRLWRSDPELVGEIVEVLADNIERSLRLALARTRTALAGPPDMAGTQPKLLSRRQVAAVRSTHHDLLGLEVERLASRQI